MKNRFRAPKSPKTKIFLFLSCFYHPSFAKKSTWKSFIFSGWIKKDEGYLVDNTKFKKYLLICGANIIDKTFYSLV